MLPNKEYGIGKAAAGLSDTEVPPERPPTTADGHFSQSENIISCSRGGDNLDNFRGSGVFRPDRPLARTPRHLPAAGPAPGPARPAANLALARVSAPSKVRTRADQAFCRTNASMTHLVDRRFEGAGDILDEFVGVAREQHPGMPARASSRGATTGRRIARYSYTLSGLVAWVTAFAFHGTIATSACARYGGRSTWALRPRKCTLPGADAIWSR